MLNFSNTFYTFFFFITFFIKLSFKNLIALLELYVLKFEAKIAYNYRINLYLFTYLAFAIFQNLRGLQMRREKERKRIII